MARISESRAVRGFTEVVLRGYGTLDIAQNTGPSGEESLVIEADDILMPRIESEIVGRRLVLGIRMPWYEWMSFWLTWIFLADKGIHYTLGATRLDDITIGGSGRARCAGLRTESLRLRIGGSGKLAAADVQATDIDARVAGSGRMECDGKAETFRARVAGSGRVKAEGLAVRRASIRIGGSGRISVNASDALDVWVEGSGRVDYRGSPAISSHVAGSGRIRSIG